MLQKSAILYVEKIVCTKTSNEAGHDDIRLNITVDGSTSSYPSDSETYWIDNKGETQNVDIAINVTYANNVTFDLWEIDGPSENEHLGSHSLTRGSTDSSPDSRTILMCNTDAKGTYYLTYRIISDPIPTVRVLGIRCEQQSAGMNVSAVQAIADVASTATEAAGKAISKSPRPRAKAIGKAFKAASNVLQGVSAIAEWIGHAIEGPYDEVYMKHVESTRGYDGAFFPPAPANYESMKNGDEIYFEEKYGHYFRFPLDRGSVTLQFREHDGGKADINIGTLTVAPDSLKPGDSAGISGTTVNGGVAVMDGAAVIELANSYGDSSRDGEGALYHICYSVGFEDWCLPATAAEQGGGVVPQSGKTYSIISKNSGKAINVSGASQENGANVEQWEFVNGNNQLFTLQDRGNGYYSIMAKHSQRVLNVSGASTADGANIQQWEFINGNNQLFAIQDRGNGYYSIIAKHSGKAIDVRDASQADGANVEQWGFGNGNNQLFAFFPE